METKQTKRTKRVTIRFAPAELEKIEKKCKSTTCRKLSEYIRLVLLDKAVTVLTRDQSKDEIMREITGLRAELHRIGVNSNQVTKKLHTLSQVAEFRAYLQQQETFNSELIRRVEEANLVINELADLWLQ